MPVAITIFRAQLISFLLYHSQICPYKDLNPIEAVQSRILRSLLQVTWNILNPWFSLELGPASMGTHRRLCLDSEFNSFSQRAIGLL